MEELRSEPVVYPKPHTLNQRKWRCEQGLHQLRRTFETSVTQHDLQEQQLRCSLRSATFKQVGLKKLNYQCNWVGFRDAKPHPQEELIIKPVSHVFNRSAPSCETAPLYATATRHGVSATKTMFEIRLLKRTANSYFRHCQNNRRLWWWLTTKANLKTPH